MKLRYSLRFRVGVALAGFTLALCLLFMAALGQTVAHIEREALMQRLEAEVQRHLAQLGDDEGGKQALPSSEYLHTFRGLLGMGPALREVVSTLPEGLHELTEFKGKPWLAVHRFGPNRPPMHFLFDTTKLQKSSPWMSRWQQRAGALSLAITLLAFLIGYRVAGPIARPVLELARISDQYGPEDVPKQMPSLFYPDEVGLLADRLWSLTDRARTLIHRERQFSRYASHELRTSVSVAKGAVELLRAMPAAQDPKVQQVASRVARAAAEMEGIIETFLWLSRDTGQLEATEQKLEPIVLAALERYHSLLEGKPIQTRIDRQDDSPVLAPAGALSIVVGNLIANAIRHTDRGNVVITLESHTLTVTDSGEGISKDILAEVFKPNVKGDRSTGYGLGLSIVRDLCTRFGWQVSLSSDERLGTRVSVHFTPPPSLLDR